MDDQDPKAEHTEAEPPDHFIMGGGPISPGSITAPPLTFRRTGKLSGRIYKATLGELPSIRNHRIRSLKANDGSDQSHS